MKQLLMAVAAAFTLSACAGTNVVHTDVASGALNPKAIYIRPFPVASTAFKGDHHGHPTRIILQSQAPAEFASILREELEKLAPAQVLESDEFAQEGWVIEGNIDLVHGGCPFARGLLGHLGAGRSAILIHVRVLDAGVHGHGDGKSGARSNVLYEFDVAGGSRASGLAGSVMASGLGYSAPFDYRNAAERIRQVFDPDGPRYGVRESASLR